MLKKITLAAAIIFSAVALVAAPKVRVDQSSQRAVCETLLRSLAYQDVDAFWVLIPAETRTALNAEGVSKNDIFQLLLKTSKFTPEIQKQMQAILNNPEQKNAVVDHLMQNGFKFKRIRGKYYLDLEAMGASAIQNMK